MKGIADYIFIERMGTGNHGTFWLAEAPERLAEAGHDRLGVKVLDHHATDQDFRRMANELQVYAAIDSPFLAPIVDAGQQDGTLYYSTPYYDSGSVGAPSRPLTLQEIINCIADASEAAHALHETGVAHRDIKPANIMVTDDGRGRLADLGLAQILTPGQTVTGVGPVGTIEFLAPELIRGEVAGRPTDIWALGATAHRALTGKSLYRDLPSNSLLDALRYLLDTSPEFHSTLPSEVLPIVKRCLLADPAQRFPTALDLATALRGVAV